MRNLARWAGVAAMGAIAWSSVGVGAAAAADIPMPEYQRQAGPEYYDEPPAAYQPPPPPVYGYPAPPPVYGYYYRGPAVAVLPGPYYRRPYYYGRPVYGVRRFAPRIARGYGPYGHAWNRGPHRW